MRIFSLISISTFFILISCNNKIVQYRPDVKILLTRDYDGLYLFKSKDSTYKKIFELDKNQNFKSEPFVYNDTDFIIFCVEKPLKKDTLNNSSYCLMFYKMFLNDFSYSLINKTNYYIYGNNDSTDISVDLNFNDLFYLTNLNNKCHKLIFSDKSLDFNSQCNVFPKYYKDSIPKKYIIKSIQGSIYLVQDNKRKILIGGANEPSGWSKMGYFDPTLAKDSSIFLVHRFSYFLPGPFRLYEYDFKTNKLKKLLTVHFTYEDLYNCSYTYNKQYILFETNTSIIDSKWSNTIGVLDRNSGGIKFICIGHNFLTIK